MHLLRNMTLSFWLACLALGSWACSESNFAGSADKRSSNSANLNGKGGPDAGDGDAGDGGPDSGGFDSGNDSGGGFDSGNDSGGGFDSGNDSGGDSDSGDSDSGEMDSGSDGDSGDSGGDDDIDLGEEENTLKTREAGILEISKHEDKFVAEFRYEKDSGWSNWIPAADGQYPLLCHKFKDTVLEMRIKGGEQMKAWISPPHKDIVDTGSGGNQVSVAVEDGGCALSFLCGEPDDFIFSMTCPNSDVTVEGMF